MREKKKILSTVALAMSLVAAGSRIFRCAARQSEGTTSNPVPGSSITPAITGGDVDADWENAYFSGDEAPGGDNPTPDQDVVEDIGAALGVKYEDNEELKAADKVIERDKHRWELDPASSEDYKDRK